jgi:hypothetical protein
VEYFGCKSVFIITFGLNGAYVAIVNIEFRVSNSLRQYLLPCDNPGAFIERFYSFASRVPWVLQSEKNAKIQTKTHEMNVLEAVENKTLESHSRDP